MEVKSQDRIEKAHWGDIVYHVKRDEFQVGEHMAQHL